MIPPRLIAVAALLAARCVSAQPAETPMDHGAPMNHAEHMNHAQHMGHAMPQRQAEVSGRGKDVMPFDLAATLHVFTKTPTGGVQQVVVRDPKDSEQALLVREHLQEIHDQFRRGDFSGPAHIHGDAMPGLAELKSAKPGAVHIVYRELPKGGELVFTSADHHLVAAIHRWFDAQVADHGKDAMAGHMHHHAH